MGTRQRTSDAPETGLLPELPEAESTAAIRAIYAELRRLCAVPMVPLIYRHLATIPGALEWAWALLGPAMRSGAVQRTAWQMLDRLQFGTVLPVPRAALRLIGVDASGEAELSTLLTAYNRANPVNLVALRCLALHLAASAPPVGRVAAPGGLSAAPTDTGDERMSGDRAGGERGGRWQPPAPIAGLIPMADPGRIDAHARALILLLTDRGDPARRSRIWPSLYRHLAMRPPLLALAALVIPPAFAEIDRVAAAVRADASARARGLADTMARPGAAAPFEPARAAALVRAIELFTERIPELIAVGALMARCLPAPEGGV